MQCDCRFAVILHIVVDRVNDNSGVTGRGRRQAARTEAQIIAAATALFLERGYIATTLADVAAAADVGDRTVYVRFGSKAALFKRVVDVAIVGDTAPVDVLGRDWMRLAFEAPTLAERIAAAASATRQIMERTGALFAVAQQAAAVEPLVAEYWQQGRDQSRYGQRMMWARAAEDGLLDPSCNVDELVDTASLLMAAETYLLATRMLGWTLDDYERWVRDTMSRLALG